MVQRVASYLEEETHFTVYDRSAPKTALLRDFRSRGDAVLVATMSFWQGVDVPGDALRLVIIDKIPFSSPDDPILSARMEWVESKKVNPPLEPSSCHKPPSSFDRCRTTYSSPH